MELSTQALTSLFTSFGMKFQEAFEMAPVYWDKLMTEVPSASRTQQYPFMGRTTRFREWKGSRVIQSAEAKLYALTNRHFEDTIGLDVDDIKDDQYGVYSKVFEQLGWDTKVFRDMMLAGLLKFAIANVDAPTAAAALENGLSFSGPDIVGYDGNTLFSAEHAVGLEGSTTVASNVNAGGGSGAYWFLWDAGRPIRPALWQDREPFKLVRMEDLNDEHIFSYREFRFGIDGRGMAGIGPWQLCYASNMDLSNPSNYGAAIAAMEAFKTDAGQPFGAWSSDPTKKFLMVPPTLRQVATQLLHGDFGAIEGAAGAVAGIPGSNIQKGTATLLVNQYLA
jgi:phage major head subunit gpT-like protein